VGSYVCASGTDHWFESSQGGWSLASLSYATYVSNLHC
jgi:hypothetical protein